MKLSSYQKAVLRFVDAGGGGWVTYQSHEAGPGHDWEGPYTLVNNPEMFVAIQSLIDHKILEHRFRTIWGEERSQIRRNTGV